MEKKIVTITCKSMISVVKNKKLNLILIHGKSRNLVMICEKKQTVIFLKNLKIIMTVKEKIIISIQIINLNSVTETIKLVMLI